MPGPWDRVMKYLLRKNPQQFTKWLVAGGTFIAELSIELKQRDTYIYADGLYKVELHGEIILLHIEFQKRSQGIQASSMLVQVRLGSLDSLQDETIRPPRSF